MRITNKKQSYYTIEDKIQYTKVNNKKGGLSWSSYQDMSYW